MIPEGMVEWVFHLGGETTQATVDQLVWTRRPVSMIGGLHSKAFWIRMTQPGPLFSIRFHPGAFAQLALIPVSKLCNIIVTPMDIWGPSSSWIVDAVLHAKNHHDRIQWIQTFLIDYLQDRVHSGIFDAVQQIFENPVRSVSELAATSGYSVSRFRQIFSEMVGASPKSVMQTRRIWALLKRSDSWGCFTEAAYGLGYFDQSHLIRECRKITGLTPRRLLKQPLITTH